MNNALTLERFAASSGTQGRLPLLVSDRSQWTANDGWRSIMKEQVGRSTYHIDVLNKQGKVVEARDVIRRSQEGAHRVSRQVLADYPTGTRLNLYRDGKLVEKFTMTKEGWTYEVVNGTSVRDAQRNYVKSHKPSSRSAINKAKVRKTTNAQKQRVSS